MGTNMDTCQFAAAFRCVVGCLTGLAWTVGTVAPGHLGTYSDLRQHRQVPTGANIQCHA